MQDGVLTKPGGWKKKGHNSLSGAFVHTREHTYIYMYRDDRMQFSIRDTRVVGYGRRGGPLSKATFRSVATFTAGHTLLRKSLMGNSFWLFEYTGAT